MKWNRAQLVLAACAAMLLSPPIQGQRPVLAHMQTISTLDGTPMLEAGAPTVSRPYLGLVLQDDKTPSGEARCLVFLVRPGPVREALGLKGNEYPFQFFLLGANDAEIHSTGEFRQLMAGLSIGAEARLRFLSTLPKPDTVRTVTARVGSWGDWAAPIDFARPPRVRIAPEDVVPAGAEPTLLEQFIDAQLGRHGISAAIEKTRQHLVRSMENNYGPSMLSRVAYGFYRPARLAELQSSITDPLVRIVARHKDNPLAVARPVLAEAAKNLDVTFNPGDPGRIDIRSPGQALRDAAGMVRRAYSHLGKAFEKIDAATRVELESSAPLLIENGRPNPPRPMASQWPESPVVRARQASMVIDYGSLIAAADAIAAWSVPGDPGVQDSLPRVAIPAELAEAVKGDILGVERIDGRWYIYGGPGANEYDMSRLDVVIDPGGDDHYRYPRNERPKVQLIVDWAGNDRYTGDNGAPGPASGLLGVSVVVDHQGNDRYEGGVRSCGAGLMGVGLILDHSGNDTYEGTRWSIGAAKYGFGGIVDLGPSSDTYLAHELSQGAGGPRGFGLILDAAGHDLYRANGPVPSNGGWPARYSGYSQGVGIADYSPGLGAFDTGGIGLLCDLDGNDRYEVGEFGQGFGFFYGLGILYDRAGRDLYYGTNVYSQAASAHGGVGILADDAGDDTYWGTIAKASDSGLALLIDRGGDDSYQGIYVGGADRQGIAWLIDLGGQDRYNIPPSQTRSVSQSSDERTHQDAAEAAMGIGVSAGDASLSTYCPCNSFSVFLDAGGTPDLYSREDRGDGMAISTGKPNPWMPQYSNLHGLFIDTKERITFWPLHQ
jgi:hypothetical protein